MKPLVQGIQLAGTAAQGGHLFKLLVLFQKGGILLHSPDKKGVVVGGQGDHPHMVFLLGQEIPFVQFGSLPVTGHPLLIAPVFLLGAQAQFFKAVGVHHALDLPVPGVRAALGQDRGHIAGKQGLEHGTNPVEQGFQRIDGIGAVLFRPEQFDQLRLGYIPIPVYDQIAKDIPRFLRAIDLIGQEISIYLYTETAQHRDRDRHPFRYGGWLFHVTFLPYFGTKRAADISSFFSCMYV